MSDWSQVSTDDLIANGQRFVSQHARSASGTATPMRPGATRAPSAPARAAGSTASSCTLAVCTATDLPLAWQVETARHHESNFVAPLLDKLHARGFQPRTAALDKGYDSNRVHAECAERDVLPVIPIKGERASQIVIPIIEGATRFNPRIQRHTPEFRSLYRRRAAVEREFGR